MEQYLRALAEQRPNEDTEPKPADTIVCPHCDEELELHAEVVRVVISYSVCEKNEKNSYPVLDEETKDYLFFAQHLHMSCYQELRDLMGEAVATHMHGSRDSGHIYTECSICPNNIREGERFGLVDYGDIVKADKYPNNQVVYLFKPWDDFTRGRICLYCLLVASGEDDDGVWSGVSEMCECMDCTGIHCWRDNACLCECHNAEEKEDEG